MGTLAFARINTTQQLISYRDFRIEESIEGWEWTHQDYDRLTFPVTGTCQTVFECIDAVDVWHDERWASEPVLAVLDAFVDQEAPLCRGASL